MRPAQEMARQRLLAERKLPTTDNKDEMLFKKRRKKTRLIVNEYGAQEGFHGGIREVRQAARRMAQGFGESGVSPDVFRWLSNAVQACNIQQSF
ncbi:hypothetical protein [Pseudomonas sp. NPDC089734]|uniref:hypothetical protein n=1 Tax=Pseudomonas sp. NPDC089734 TaxID=3364469 RepID=UPI003804EF6D